MEAATKLLPEYGFVSGTMALQRRKSTVLHITTGCEALNQILGGGPRCSDTRNAMAEAACISREA